jgi:hypothetical protein
MQDTAPFTIPSTFLTESSRNSRTHSRSQRRRATSDLERASTKLSHAVEYLVAEQLEGRRSPVSANRQAVAILCDAGRKLASEERRRPARGRIREWLRSAALFRAPHE